MLKRILVSLVCAVCFCVACLPLSSCKKEAKVATRYEITVEYAPENATLAGTAKVTFENYTDNALEELKFQLYPNAYRKDAEQKAVSKLYEQEAYYAG